MSYVPVVGNVLLFIVENVENRIHGREMVHSLHNVNFHLYAKSICTNSLLTSTFSQFASGSLILHVSSRLNLSRHNNLINKQNIKNATMKLLIVFQLSPMMFPPTQP